MDYTGFIPERITLYVFDLDGTLIDSLEDLALSVNEILSRYGLPSIDSETVRNGVGIGARNLLFRSFAASAKLASDKGNCPGHIAETGIQRDPDPLTSNEREHSYPGFADIVAEALVPYREYYEAHCTDHARLYPGMLEWLASLDARGCSTAVLTNKPDDASRRILASLGVDKYFRVIAGPDWAGALKPRPDGVLKIMNEFGASPDQTVLVGDSFVDIETARNAGILMCGISGGLGDDDALRESAPDILIERI